MIHRGSNDVIRTCAGLASKVNMGLTFFLALMQVSLPGRHMNTGLRRQVIRGLRNICEEDAEKKYYSQRKLFQVLLSSTS